MDSILTSVKEMLGIAEEYTHFDSVLIRHINSVFMILTQMGIGPPEGFTIQSAEQEWSDFVSEEENLEAVKTYMGHRVQLAFDPPASSTIIESTKRILDELEWRLYTASEFTSY